MTKTIQKRDPFLDYSSDDSSNNDEDDCRNCCSAKNYNYFSTFLRESSIHGLKYIGQLQQSNLARIFWVVVFAGGVGTSVYLIMIGVVADIMANPVIMSFQESEITIDRIPFPAVTICSSSKRKTSVFVEQLNEYVGMLNRLHQMNASISEKEDLARRYRSLVYLLEICRDSNGFSDRFKATDQMLGNIEMPIKDVAEVDFIMTYAKKVLHKCENIVLLCMWANKPFDCTADRGGESSPPPEDIFMKSIGNCCTYNMMPEFILRKNFPHRPRNTSSNIAWKERNKGNRRHRRKESEIEAWKKWAIDKHLIEEDTKQNKPNASGIDVPKHQRSAGMSSGLSILVHPDFDHYLDNRFPTCDSLDGIGLRVQVHSPIDYPHIADFGKTIQSNSETFVDITAAITTPDKDVEGVSKKKRQCYFNHEYNLSAFKDYTQKNCVDQCIMEEIYKQCKCVRIYMPRENQPLCINNKDYACMKNASSIIRQEGTLQICDHCWPSCTQLEYFASVTQLPLRDDVDIWKKSFASVENAASNWSQKDVAIVHLFFSKETVESRSRKSLYGVMEILASAGGLLGLTLGMSMISFIEPLYFLTIRLLFERKLSPQPRMDGDKIENKKQKSQPTHIFVQSVHSKMKKNEQNQFVVKHIPRAWIQN